MSRRLLLLDLVIVAAGALAAVPLVWTLLESPRLPPPPAVRAAQPAAPAQEERRPVPPQAYDVIATRTVFNPNRSESTAVVSTAPLVKPVVHGIVESEDTFLAFMEDPVTKKVFGYKPGDQVPGGQLERVEADRVVIRRGEGTFEVLLRDPAKPRPVVAAPPATPAQPRPTSPAAPVSPAPQPPAPAPGSPAVQAPPVTPPPPQVTPPSRVRRPPIPLFPRPQAPPSQ